MRPATLEGFANGSWQPGRIEFGAFDQENQIHQVFDAGIFPARSRQSVGDMTSLFRAT